MKGVVSFKKTVFYKFSKKKIANWFTFTQLSLKERGDISWLSESNASFLRLRAKILLLLQFYDIYFYTLFCEIPFYQSQFMLRYFYLYLVILVKYFLSLC